MPKHQQRRVGPTARRKRKKGPKFDDDSDSDSMSEDVAALQDYLENVALGEDEEDEEGQGQEGGDRSRSVAALESFARCKVGQMPAVEAAFLEGLFSDEEDSAGGNSSTSSEGDADADDEADEEEEGGVASDGRRHAGGEAGAPRSLVEMYPVQVRPTAQEGKRQKQSVGRRGSRLLPGEKKRLRKAGIKAKRAARAAERGGLDPEEVNQQLGEFVQQGGDMHAFAPMDKYVASLAARMAGCYGLKASMQGSGKKRILVVRPTAHTGMPAGGNVARLEQIVAQETESVARGIAGGAAAVAGLNGPSGRSSPADAAASVRGAWVDVGPSRSMLRAARAASRETAGKGKKEAGRPRERPGPAAARKSGGGSYFGTPVAFVSSGVLPMDQDIVIELPTPATAARRELQQQQQQPPPPPQQQQQPLPPPSPPQQQQPLPQQPQQQQPLQQQPQSPLQQRQAPHLQQFLPNGAGSRAASALDAAQASSNGLGVLAEPRPSPTATAAAAVDFPSTGTGECSESVHHHIQGGQSVARQAPLYASPSEAVVARFFAESSGQEDDMRDGDDEEEGAITGDMQDEEEEEDADVVDDDGWAGCRAGLGLGVGGGGHAMGLGCAGWDVAGMELASTAAAAEPSDSEAAVEVEAEKDEVTATIPSGAEAEAEAEPGSGSEEAAPAAAATAPPNGEGGIGSSPIPSVGVSRASRLLALGMALGVGPDVFVSEGVVAEGGSALLRSYQQQQQQAGGKIDDPGDDAADLSMLLTKPTGKQRRAAARAQLRASLRASYPAQQQQQQPPSQQPVPAASLATQIRVLQQQRQEAPQDETSAGAASSSFRNAGAGQLASSASTHGRHAGGGFAAFERHTTGFGSRMLEKWGFGGYGSGLGAQGNGIAEPVQSFSRPKRLGLGAGQ